MAKDKTKSLRERFEEEYIATVEPCNNKKGYRIKYVYYGNWYVWNLPEKQLVKTKVRIGLLALCDILLYTWAAAFPSDLNGYKLVAFTGIGALLSLVLKLIGIGQFMFAKNKTSRSNFEDAGRRIRAWSVIQIVCLLASMAGCIYYLIAYGFYINRLVTTLLYPADAAVCYVLYRIYAKIPARVEKNDVLKHVKLATATDMEEEQQGVKRK